MAYAKRFAGGFFDFPTTTTPIDSAFLNAVETALLKLQAVDPSADAQVLQYDNANTRYAPALLLNKNIDPAAAIAKSKIDLTGANGIVNADVAGAAALALSKLAATGTIGTSPISVGVAGKTALQIADSGAQLGGLTIGGDTNLYRATASVLETDGQLKINWNSPVALQLLGTGSGLTIGGDSNLYRSGVNILKTDGMLQAAGGLTPIVLTVAATDVNVPLNAIGTIAVDATGNRIYVRCTGGWKSAALA